MGDLLLKGLPKEKKQSRYANGWGGVGSFFKTGAGKKKKIDKTRRGCVNREGKKLFSGGVERDVKEGCFPRAGSLRGLILW